jgi:hypothetical protein
MKKYIKYIAIMLLVTSCEYEADLFKSIKGSPTFTIMYEGEEIETINDSIKIPIEKISQTQIPFTVLLNDKSSMLKLSVDEINGIGEIEVNNEILNESANIEPGKIEIKYSPSIEGEHIFDLIITDEYGKNIKKRCRFLIFNNLPPVAQLDVVKIGQNSKYEIEVRGHESYDQDSQWGGKVVRYIFKVGNYYTYETERFSTIKHILPSEGTYIISLQVVDDDNSYSNTVFQEIKF